MKSRLRAPRCSSGALAYAFVALAVLGVVGCAVSGPYRATWQPMTREDVYPRVLDYAIALEPSEVEMVTGAGGVFIGYHATRRGYSPRAASVGGTHYVAVAGDVTAHTSCSGGFVGRLAVGFCSTRSGYRPTKIAVYRVEPALWAALPPHLVPPTDNVEEGVWAAATRDGCRVGNARGMVRCSNSWSVRSHVPPGPPPAAPPPVASTTAVPEVPSEPTGSDVPTNPY